MPDQIDPRLAFAFAAYVCSPSARLATELSILLEASGLLLESAGVLVASSGENDGFAVPSGPMAGREASLAAAPPAEARVGALWFDAVELSTYVYLARPGERDRARWVALSPTRAWQFEAFRLLAVVGPARTEFTAPDDYLARAAFPAEAPLAGDVYHDEALGYAHWFGRSLTGRYEWNLAQSVLKPDQLAAMLPEGGKFWEEAEFPGSEFVRVAIGRDNRELTAADLLGQFEAAAKPPEDVRGIHDEWERSPSIGFSTCIIPALASADDEPPATLIFDYENAARFPAGLS